MQTNPDTPTKKRTALAVLFVFVANPFPVDFMEVSVYNTFRVDLCIFALYLIHYFDLEVCVYEFA
jgi:hypothetical protein